MNNETPDEKKPTAGNYGGGNQTDPLPRTNEKTTLGGDFNTGVTSDDPAEKEEIERKGTMANVRTRETPPDQQPLVDDDLPDSSNESTGATGSGQRQDSN
jgi:hypothetical protein